MSGWGRERANEVKEAFYEFLNHVECKSKERGWFVLGENLYDAQIRVIEGIFDGLARGIHDFKILKSRQLGVSTIIRALMLFWSGIFELTGVLVFHTGQALDDAKTELVDMLERMSPSYNFPRKARSNRFMLSLANKSRIAMMAAGVKETKGSNALGASFAISLAHRSELCSYGNKAGLEAMRHSMARTNPNRIFVDESTARGRNLWWEIWNDAKKDPDCICIFIGWWSHPGQVIARGTSAFEKYTRFPLSDEEKQKIKIVKERYGHEITVEQIAWIRKEMDFDADEDDPEKKDFSGDPIRKQEQPWCVVGDTRVGTDAGLIRIDEVMPGMLGTLGTIVRVEQTAVARIWRVKTKLGYTVRGSAYHPLINAAGDEIRLDQSIGHIVKLQSPKFSQMACVTEWREGPTVCRTEITPEFARLVGLYMGDGSLQGAGKHGGAGYFAIVCDKQDQDVLDECVRLIKVVFGVDAPTRQQGETNCIEVRVGSRLIVDTFRKLGLARNDIGKTMRKIHVPDFIFRSPKHIIKEFLSGLFEADGYNGWESHRVALFSKYPKFIADIQVLLLGFGITSRRVSTKKTNGEGREHTGNQLELRTMEARRFNHEIGFLSHRKKNRHIQADETYRARGDHSSKPILLQDEIVEVVDEGADEPVYNLTIDGTHLFDANGILTHNCEEESWQSTESAFFDPEKLNDQANKWASNKFSAYMFMAGFEFTDFTAIKAPNQRSVQLKVWEEPIEDSVYIVAADPAYGINEHNDRSCVQVVRCFSDGVDQVAEYAWPLIDAQQLAWVMAALEAWYAGERSEIYRILEINGPGEATFRELRSLKQKIQLQYFGSQLADRGLTNIQRNVRDYLYSRTDSMNPGHNYMFRTHSQLKVAIMERLRDFTNNGVLRIRSHETIDEMCDITREGDSIGASNSDHDDRPLALALACRQWEEGPRRRLMAARRTREAEIAKRRMTTVDMVKAFNTNQLGTFLAGRDAGRRAQLIAMQGRGFGRRR